MEFYVKDENGQEQGPLDLRTIEKWIAIDKITGDTPVRNALMGAWKKVEDIEQLKHLLNEQALRLEKHEEETKGFFDRTLELMGVANSAKKSAAPKSSYFKNEYLPHPPPFTLRIMAALTDCLLLAIVASIFLFVGAGMVYSYGLTVTLPAIKTDTKPPASASSASLPTDAKADSSLVAAAPVVPRADKLDAKQAPSASDDKSVGYARGSKWLDTVSGKRYTCLNPSEGAAVWTDIDYVHTVFFKFFPVLCLIALLYLGLSLGIFAQTVGMWFWGVFLVKKDLSEAYFGRAYLFAVLLILLGWLTPVFSLMNRQRRSLHELLAGVWVIRISARPKS